MSQEPENGQGMGSWLKLSKIVPEQSNVVFLNNLDHWRWSEFGYWEYESYPQDTVEWALQKMAREIEGKCERIEEYGILLGLLAVGQYRLEHDVAMYRHGVRSLVEKAIALYRSQMPYSFFEKEMERILESAEGTLTSMRKEAQKRLRSENEDQS